MIHRVDKTQPYYFEDTNGYHLSALAWSEPLWLVSWAWHKAFRGPRATLPNPFLRGIFILHVIHPSLCLAHIALAIRLEALATVHVFLAISTCSIFRGTCSLGSFCGSTSTLCWLRGLPSKFDEPPKHQRSSQNYQQWSEEL